MSAWIEILIIAVPVIVFGIILLIAFKRYLAEDKEAEEIKDRTCSECYWQRIKNTRSDGKIEHGSWCQKKIDNNCLNRTLEANVFLSKVAPKEKACKHFVEK